ncbi:MAG: hypothetical protein RXO23_02705 [Vulcanisaeta sp.]|jgi:hypothetical protein
MVYVQVMGLTWPLAITVAVVVIAIIIALLYRLGYFGRGGRDEGGEEVMHAQVTSEQLRKEQGDVQRAQGRSEVGVQGGRALLVETRPVGVRPLQSPERPVDLESIEKLIRGIEGELVKIIRQTSAETADLLLTKVSELRQYIDQLVRQCTAQYPPFSQVGYVPSSISEFRELFGATYVELVRGGEVIEYTGEQTVDEELVKQLLNYNMDFMVVYHNGKYIYLVRHDDYSLILVTENYLDPVSSGLVKTLFRRFIEEAIKQQG